MKKALYVLIAVVLGGLVARAAVKASGCAIGTFDLHSGGIYHGNGSAEVDTTEVSIHLFLLMPDGRQFRVDATDMPRNGNYFSGAAAIDGRKGTVFGRLDLARASRVSATFTTLDAKPLTGRFIGTFRNEPVNGEWVSVFGQ